MPAPTPQHPTGSLDSARRHADAADPKVASLVAEYLAEKQSTEASARPRLANQQRTRALLLTGLTVLCAAAWFAPYPTQAPHAPVDPRVERASGRVLLFLAAQSINHFRATSGRLPSSLAEAGVERNELTYEPRPDGSFVIETGSGPAAFSYHSYRPISSILGNAEAIIAQTGQ